MRIRFTCITADLVLTGCARLGAPAGPELTTAAVLPPDEVSANLQDAVFQVPLVDANCFVEATTWAQYVPPGYTNVWDRIRAGLSLEFSHNDRIDTHLQWYARNPGYIERVSERANPYLYAIVEKLESRGMPLELALLPVVESAFDPFAYSHGRASGMWQFIQATGSRYGLKKTDWYDGRRDVEAATDAALDYLSDLHKRFDGDWLLALASYNTGEGNVARAVRRNRRAGKPADFWALRLPRETEAYVPQLLALVTLLRDQAQYDVAFQPVPNNPYYAAVDVGSQIDLAKAAEFAGLELEDLYLLNPGFNRWATDPNGPHRLLLPVDKAPLLEEKLKEYPREKRLAWESYQVKQGDSLLAIARRYGTEVDAIKIANNLRGSMIRAGQKLLVPIATKPSAEYIYSSEQRLARTQARSRGKPGTKKVFYHVQSGDSLWKIAQQHNVNVGSLAKWNGMAPRDVLRPGRRLLIWAPDNGTTVASNARTGNEVIRKVHYRVRKGDSLARIASKFNLRVNDIVQWNSISKNKYIHPGQTLTLLVDITRAN